MSDNRTTHCSSLTGGMPVRGILRVLDWLENAFAVLSAGGLAWITLTTTVAVLGRYFLNQPLAWTIELSEYLLVYITFLAGGYITREDVHVRLEIGTGWLGPKGIRTLDTIWDAAGCVIFLIMTGAGAWLTWESYVKGIVLETNLPVPRWLAIGIIPIGACMVSLRYLRMVIARLQGARLERHVETL